MSGVTKHKTLGYVVELPRKELELSGRPEDVIASIEVYAQDVLEPYIEWEYEGYEGGYVVVLTGYRPATDAEIAKYKEQNKKRKARAREQKEKAKKAEESSAALRALAALKLAEEVFPERFS